MSGPIVLRQVLTGNANVTALIPAESIIADDAFPQGFVLPGMLLRSTSLTPHNVIRRGNRRHVFERVSVGTHCSDSPTRAALKRALRNAGDQQFPMRDSLENIAVEFLGHMADGMSTTTFARMIVTDFMVSYSEEATG